MIRKFNLFEKQQYIRNRSIKCFSEKISPTAPLNSFSIGGEAISGKPAYLDFQATTPMDPRVSGMYILNKEMTDSYCKSHVFVTRMIFMLNLLIELIHICMT